MDPITQQVVLASAGAAGGAEATYVDDVFSTFLYDGNGGNQSINNGLRIGNAISGLKGYSMYATQGTSYTSIVPSGATFQEAITNGVLSGNNDDFVYSGGSVLDIYVDLVDAAVATAVKFAPQGDVGSNVVYNTPSSLTIYGSNDASSWTTLDTNTGLSSSNFTAGSFTTFSFSNSTGYRYYRIAAPAGASISEWELVATSETAGEGGLVWVKNRDSAVSHVLAGPDLVSDGYTNLASDLNTDAGTETNYVTSFSPNGFTVGNSGSVNDSSDEYCSWAFRKASGFFDVVNYIGNGTNQSIAHNLGSVPGCIMIKNLDANTHWVVYHRGISVPAEKALVLSENWGEDDDVYFNDTAPTSTHFTVGPKTQTNTNNETYIAYLFAHDDQSFGTDSDESIIKCGSYTGNGSSTGPVIDLGFEPQWLLVKLSSTNGGYWVMLDNMRGVNANGETSILYANDTSQEVTSTFASFSSTGFQPRTGSNYMNSSGQTYVYMAIRRPHKPPTAGTDVFNTSEAVGTPRFQAPFVTDMMIGLGKNGYNNKVFNRLTGTQHMELVNTNAEITFSNMTWDYMNGAGENFTSSTFFAYMFRRAPGFFDAVTYTGTGSARTVTHNLGAVPELMIVKVRNFTYNWFVYAAPQGNSKYGLFSETYGDRAFDTDSAVWNSTTPTSTQFSVGTAGGVNGSGYTYVSYLFASLNGISKVGSYSGTGNNVNVDCGFTAGARFVLIKRTDSTGDWYVYDTARGIVSGNDPYLLLNSNAAQVTNTDYIDPLNAGFTVTSSAPAALNTSGGTYIFLAIA